VSTPLAAGAESVLLFNWNPSRRRKVALASFLVASLALHALGFYIFQIIYPPTVSLLPPPGRVSVIAPTSEEGRVMLRWIEAEDPALALTTQRPSEAKAFALPKVPHVPTYLTHEPQLRKPPPYVPDLRAPDALPPGPVVRPRPQPPTPSASVSKTSVQFSDATRLGTLQPPEMKFTRSTNDPPQAAEFRVAVGPAGDVRYCFPQTSSGDPALDEQAQHYLALCRFAGKHDPAGESALTWTTATLTWGNDLAAPAAARSPTPRP
jgi:hypothetical protein